MPNAKILNEKKQIVEELTGKLKSQAGVLVNYSGITVNEDTEMRVKLRDANIDYTVIKNTLMRFAIANAGFEDLDPILNGTTSLAVSKDDPIAPARLIKEYADKFNGYFEIKGGFMDGKVLSVDEVNALAIIPPLPILQAQLLGTMLAPITSLAVVLKAIAEKDSSPADAEIVASAEVSDEAPQAAETAEVTLADAAETAEEAPAETAVVDEAPAEAAAADEAPAEAEAADEAPAEATAEEAE
jgi:large subunit ribosomal protein L10